MKLSRLVFLPLLSTSLLGAAGLKDLVDQKIASEYASLEAIYKDIHANPELSFVETRTAALLAREMKALGFEVTEKFGVTFDYEGDTNAKDYVVNHYAAVFIVDPKARIRAYVLPPHDVSRVSQVLMAVRNYYGE